MRLAEKERKCLQSQIPFKLDPVKKIAKIIAKKFKIIKKISFWHYFQLKQDEIGQEREKKILGPNSIPTGPRQENSEKNSKKIRKIKKPLSSIIPSQNEMRQARKERQKFQSRIPFLVDPVKKIRKNIAKNFRKFKKPLSGIIFS